MLQSWFGACQQNPLRLFLLLLVASDKEALYLLLFILAEELWSLHLQKLLSMGTIQSVSTVTNTPCHLFYANDILLFTTARISSLLAIKNLLVRYQNIAGQVFKMYKSQTHIGKCNHRKRGMITLVLNIPVARNQKTYLGVPLFYGSPKNRHFAALLDKFHAKLTGWKAKALSFAGRLVLVNHVLASLSTHTAMVLPLTSSICVQIEKLMRNFLWSGDESPKRKNYVRWALVCLPKAKGGLGVRKVAEMNKASFLKLGWQSATSSSLWASQFRRRYFKSNSIWSCQNPIASSCIWKKIRQLSPFINIGSRWQLGNGNLMNIWHDEWWENIIIANYHFPLDVRLSLMLNGNSWNIPSKLPQAILNIISRCLNSSSQRQIQTTLYFGKAPQMAIYLTKWHGNF